MVGKYVDAGVSGTTVMRPEFQALLSATEKQPRPFDIIVVYNVDRFGRSKYDAAYKQTIRARDIRIEYVSGPNTDDHGGEFLERIYEAVAQDFSAQLRHRVPLGQRQAVLDGRHGTGLAIAPFGYTIASRSDGKRFTKFLEPHPETASILTDLFQRYANGASIRSLARWLNDTIDTPAVLNKRAPRGKTHGHWLGGTILRILRNPVYCGIITYGRRHVVRIEDRVREIRTSSDTWTRYKDAHEALVAQSLFDAVQTRLAQQVQYRPRGDRPTNILGRLGRCGSCGGSVTMEHNGIKGKSYYYCRTYRRHKIGNPSCKHALRRETVEAELFHYLSAIWRPATSNLKIYYSESPDMKGWELGLISTPDAAALEKAVAAYNSRLDEPQSSSQHLAIGRIISKLETQRYHVLNAIESGTPPSSLLQRLHELETRIATEQRKQLTVTASVKKSLAPLDANKIRRDADTLRQALEHQSPEEIRALLPLIVSEVLVNFAFDERASRNAATKMGKPFDTYGTVVVHTIYDPRNIDTASADALRAVARIAAI